MRGCTPSSWPCAWLDTRAVVLCAYRWLWLPDRLSWSATFMSDSANSQFSRIAAVRAAAPRSFNRQIGARVKEEIDGSHNS